MIAAVWGLVVFAWVAAALIVGLFVGAVALRREEAHAQAEDAARRRRLLRGELL